MAHITSARKLACTTSEVQIHIKKVCVPVGGVHCLMRTVALPQSQWPPWGFEEVVRWRRERTTAESRTLLPTYSVAPERSSIADTFVRYKMRPFLSHTPHIPMLTLLSWL